MTSLCENDDNVLWRLVVHDQRLRQCAHECSHHLINALHIRTDPLAARPGVTQRNSTACARSPTSPKFSPFSPFFPALKQNANDEVCFLYANKASLLHKPSTSFAWCWISVQVQTSNKQSSLSDVRPSLSAAPFQTPNTLGSNSFVSANDKAQESGCEIFLMWRRQKL